ncbi:winged helix-turn-helix transcriptional regulator [Candidatus Bathyarchaeota archaeon]|nr:MAG: winged helix-turn-helix transcriptional regulator [Candidatus Bathyarchaeota archaeon]
MTTTTTEEQVTNGQGLEHILSSTGRIRILQHLAHIGEANLTEIARRTSQSYTATARHLEQLVQAAAVQEKNYGRVRIFRLRMETERMKRLRDLIIEWDQGGIEP